MDCPRGNGVTDKAAGLGLRGPEFDPSFFQMVFSFFPLGHKVVGKEMDSDMIIYNLHDSVYPYIVE